MDGFKDMFTRQAAAIYAVIGWKENLAGEDQCFSLDALNCSSEHFLRFSFCICIRIVKEIYTLFNRRMHKVFCSIFINLIAESDPGSQ